LEQLKISFKKDPSYVDITLFTMTEYSIHRGRIGLAKKGKIRFDIDYLEVRDTIIEYEKESVKLGSVMSSIMYGSKAVHSHCNDRYGQLGDTLSFSYCKTT